MRSRVSGDRGGEALDRQLRDRDPLGPRLRNGANRIEGDIDTPRFLFYRAGVVLDGLLVESIDLRRLRGSTCGDDLLRHLFDRTELATRQKDFFAVAGKCTGCRPADRASGTVDDRVLVLEQHHSVFLSAPFSGSPLKV